MMKNSSQIRIFVLLLLVCIAKSSTSNSRNGCSKEFSLVLYSKNASVVIPIGNASSLVHRQEFNTQLPSMFYIWGWQESLDSATVKMVVEAFRTSKSHNLILVDWSNTTRLEYSNAVNCLPTAANAISKAISAVVSGNYSQDLIHLTGHSLGGQCSAAVGQLLNGTLPSVTALDPAGVFFDGIVSQSYVSTSAAAFVQVIHTDMYVNGLPGPAGHVDFYPNGGTKVQPECPFFFDQGSAQPITGTATDVYFCSHRMSVVYYARSVVKTDTYVGTECQSELEFIAGNCTGNAKAVLGIAADPSSRGNFYLITDTKGKQIG